ncbi:PorP/SprF family type IX secretion system membrane protein [Winogradskyella ursingii]|uniref:PorP/SprF family type IX secretion system membrane protein n=1 Tax=Winogradskyella ursingii TaxID=2686079 RepID=UPI0015CB60E3|nr:PorP/SprF family type IX secretion system membrane protein [Winogradskyella ursingii]
MKITLTILIFLCVTQMLQTQEDDGVVALSIPVRNSLTLNRFVMNPTFSFVREQTKYISITNKREWVQFDNAPETYLASFAGRFGENIGAGVGFFQQNYGVLTTFGGVFNFAYNAQLSRFSNLTFGLNMAAYSSGINTSKTVTNFEDPSLQNVPSNFLMTVNPGINYGTDFFDFGVSINNLVTYNFNTSKLIEENPEQGIQGHIMYTGFINSRGFFDESKFSGLLRSEFKTDETIISAMAMVTVPKGIWAQLGFNTVFGASGGVGLNITNSIALEYNYETPLGDLNVFGPSHEISLAYRFQNNRNFDYSNEEEVAGIFSGMKPRRASSRRRNSNRKNNTTTVASRDTNKEANEEDKTNQSGEALKKLEAEKIAKAQIEAEEIARIAAEQKAKEEADEKERLAAQVEAQRVETAKQKARATIAAQKAQEQKDAEAKAKLLAEQKAKEEAEAIAIEKQQQEDAKKQAAAEAQAKLLEEQKAKELAEAQLKAEQEQKAIEEADAKLLEEQKQTEIAAKLVLEEQAKIDAEEKANALAQQQAILEEERKVKEEAEGQAQLEIDKLAEQELISNPQDAVGKALYSLDQQAKQSEAEQNILLQRLNEVVISKDQTLRDLKEENDLSEKGIAVAPKPFKSITAENNELKAIKADLDKIIEDRNQKIEELKSLYEDNYQADTLTNDVVMLYYKKEIKRLTAEQLKAIQTKASLDAQLETIRVATEFERRRRIKRAAFDNEEKRYTQDRAVLKSLKENTALTSTPFKASDFDFGEKQSENIKILKNVNNVEDGYFLVIAVHNDLAKRDEFLKKVIASGRNNVDFFYDVNTSNYYIYYDKFDSIGAATEGMKTKGNRPYNVNMSLIKIEN